jgi:citrate synthase
MKTILALSLCGMLFAVKAEDQIRIVRHGTNVTAQPSTVFTTNIIRLLESCGFNSTDYAVEAETWRQRERADSVVVLTLSPPRSLTVCTFTPADDNSVSNNVAAWAALRRAKRETKLIDAILIPLPEHELPDHIFARSGTNVFAVTKMSPYALRDVAFEPVLHLSSGTAYESLVSLPPPNR